MSEEITLTLLVPPLRTNTGVDILQNRIVEGAESLPIARCHSTGERPAALISWRSSRLGSLEHLDGDGQSILNVIPSRFMHGSVVECVINHEALESPIIHEMTLDVQYAPEQPVMKVQAPDCEKMQTMNLICEDSKFKANPP